MQTAVRANNSRPGQIQTEYRRPKILVVEDSEDNRAMMKRLLEMSGYDVWEAVNGEQAVQKAEKVNPDLILMDLSLPRIDGLAASRLIRALPGFTKVPIIVVSAHDTSDFHAEALASGCNEYVTKPIDFGQLEMLLKRLAPRH